MSVPVFWLLQCPFTWLSANLINIHTFVMGRGVLLPAQLALLPVRHALLPAAMPYCLPPCAAVMLCHLPTVPRQTSFCKRACRSSPGSAANHSNPASAASQSSLPQQTASPVQSQQSASPALSPQPVSPTLPQQSASLALPQQTPAQPCLSRRSAQPCLRSKPSPGLLQISCPVLNLHISVS